MNRTTLLISLAVLLLICTIVYHIYANWGLITVHAKAQPLSSVIASIERQGHAKIETNLPLDTPVTMDVVKVHLPDALETLSTVTESRWRLLYFVAGDKATLQSGETAWTSSGQRPDGWHMVSFPMPNLAMGDEDEDAAPPDPRQDVWTVKTAAPAPVQTFLNEAAQATNAGFAYPEAWNPSVSSAPASGEIRRVVPKLISAAGGREDQVFFLSKPFRRQRTAGDNTGATDGATMRPDPGAIAARVQSQIDRLPPEKRSEAQAAFNTERTFWQSLQGMSPDQRSQAIQQHLQDPNVQQQMANRMDGRDARMNHAQRMQHFQNIVNRKMAAQSRTQ